MEINGIPTVFKGRRYRSRLEARWACFFTLLCWQYEYEPYDLNGWIPDFAILGNEEIIAEVKPFLKFEQFDTNKMVSATANTEKRGAICCCLV